MFALDSHAQTSQPTGYGGISGVDKFGVNFFITQTDFGSSVANIGDIDNNGTDDLAIGANRLSISGLNHVGGVVIFLLNADNTVKPNAPRITHSTDAGGLQLSENGSFGISVANIGDFNGDEINELAVGTLNGEIYLLRLTASGQLHSFSTINTNDINDILEVDSVLGDTFGVSIANLGDIDGDGVIDLAVGAHRGDGGDRGSVHISIYG